MNESTVVLVGNAVTDVHRHTTTNGHTLARLRMVVQERRFDRGLDRYVDGEPSYFTVIAWRQVAENVIASVKRGDPIVVSGRLRVREWQAEDGRTRTSSEVTANAIGHDLARGRTVFSRPSKSVEGAGSVVTPDAA